MCSFQDSKSGLKLQWWTNYTRAKIGRACNCCTIRVSAISANRKNPLATRKGISGPYQTFRGHPGGPATRPCATWRRLWSRHAHRGAAETLLRAAERHVWHPCCPASCSAWGELQQRSSRWRRRRHHPMIAQVVSFLSSLSVLISDLLHWGQCLI